MERVPTSIPTARGLLRATVESDSSFIEALARREAVTRFIGGLSTEGGVASVLLLLEIDGERAGAFGLAPSGALEGKDFELFCALDQSHEGNGLATEGCSILIEWALNQGALPRVLACVHDSNVRSRCLVDRLGMKRIGRRYSSPEDVYAAEL